jgi:glycosyltransferase involved in cell wall biosynthesis
MVGTPVVVHGACSVTRHHVEESRGGLYFSSAHDLAGVTSYLLNDPQAREKHASAGALYVRREYSWPAVLARFDQVVERLLSAQASTAAEALAHER